MYHNCNLQKPRTPSTRGVLPYIRDLKIRRRRVSTTADLVEGGWGEVAVAMAGKLGTLRSDDGECLRRQTWSRGDGERSPLQWRENYP